MTSELADVEVADRISRRRARGLIICGVLFLTGQGLWFTEGQTLADASPVKAGI